MRDLKQERSGSQGVVLSLTPVCVWGGQRSYPERCPKEEAQGPFLFSLKLALRITPGLGCSKIPPPLTYWNSELKLTSDAPCRFLILTRFAFPHLTLFWALSVVFSVPHLDCPVLCPPICFPSAASVGAAHQILDLNNPEVLARSPNNPLFLGSQVSSTHEILSHGVIRAWMAHPLI